MIEALTPGASTIRRTIADEPHSKRDRFQGIRNEVCSLVGSKSLSLSRRSKLGKDISSSCTRRCPLGVGAQPDELLKSRSSWNICRGRCTRGSMAGLAEQHPGCGSCAVPFFRKNREDDQQIEICRPPPPQYLLSISVSGGLPTRGFSLRRGVFDGSMSEGTWGNFTKRG